MSTKYRSSRSLAALKRVSQRPKAKKVSRTHSLSPGWPKRLCATSSAASSEGRSARRVWVLVPSSSARTIGPENKMLRPAGAG
ncbi:hypothetical protein AB595_05780 [Massilia sp. WF1]|uniref:hypothetical protein n=1 Tax=unclassified Massilia TaxID=2609279 RepID=UPI00064AB701|nr:MULTISPECIES: hypothetical protein [unclassified Massilia]ALK96324.1 hypothetical protein AM586_08555 [Massilia sp. WG5]KLU37691.1 hypothetical protein AB595_05780 [Massilia sp. WF1]